MPIGYKENTMTDSNTVVATFADHEIAELAVKKLASSGVNMEDRKSVV